jgi:hypothetical protein
VNRDLLPPRIAEKIGPPDEANRMKQAGAR